MKGCKLQFLNLPRPSNTADSRRSQLDRINCKIAKANSFFTSMDGGHENN